MNSKQWKIVHDCDGENGEPTCWALKVADKEFYWIDDSDNGFDIIGKDGKTVLMTCKSLASAKRWVTVNLL